MKNIDRNETLFVKKTILFLILAILSFGLILILGFTLPILVIAKFAICLTLGIVGIFFLMFGMRNFYNAINCY